MLEGGAVAGLDDVTSHRVVRQMDERIRERARQLGRRTMEVDSGSDGQDMMLEAVGARFGGCRATQPLVILSGNGSAPTARDTCAFARQPGLTPCSTPVKSPQSNGISEAFAHPLTRDHVQLTPLPDAASALASIGAPLDTCHPRAPGSGLKMRSPREPIHAQTATA